MSGVSNFIHCMIMLVIRVMMLYPSTPLFYQLHSSVSFIHETSKISSMSEDLTVILHFHIMCQQHKGGRCVRLTTYRHPAPLSRNLGTLTSCNTLGHSGPVTGLLYLLPGRQQPHVQWVPGPYRGWRRPGRGADPPPPSSAEVLERP